jgi:hypothetical protein
MMERVTHTTGDCELYAACSNQISTGVHKYTLYVAVREMSICGPPSPADSWIYVRNLDNGITEKTMQVS